MDYMYIIEEKRIKHNTMLFHCPAGQGHLMKLKHFVDVCQKDTKVTYIEKVS